MSVKMLAPGIYDRDGECWIVTGEMAAYLGLPLDWVNENIERLYKQVIAEQFGEDAGGEFVTLEGPPPWRGQG